jgi:hypothetical protein
MAKRLLNINVGVLGHVDSGENVCMSCVHDDQHDAFKSVLCSEYARVWTRVCVLVRACKCACACGADHNLNMFWIATHWALSHCEH